jgi:hypothetical protein
MDYFVYFLYFIFLFKFLTITIRYNLPFSETLDVRNPWNNNKPVKISRDGQELSPEVGVSLCKLLDEGFARQSNKRKSSFEDTITKKTKVEILFDDSNSRQIKAQKNSEASEKESFSKEEIIPPSNFI